jgi:hypothetical protein
MDQRTELTRQRQDQLFARLLPRPGPKMFGAAIWWAFGMWALFMASAPYTPSPVEEQRYHDLMSEAVYSPEAQKIQRDLMVAQHALDQVNVWGWRWREPYARLRPEKQRDLDQVRYQWDESRRYRDELMSEAKAQVGLWSAYGVEEVREKFWAAYQSGKDFAKRMTFWDVMLGGIGGRRDEEGLAVVLRLVGQVMMNFTVGLVSALVSFTFSLFSMLWTYKASYLSGLVFFAIAFTGASAMVVAFIGTMYATAVGGVYMIAQNANNARLQGRGQQQRRYVRQQHYEHYD